MGWWRNSSHFSSYILHSLSTVTSNLILHSTHNKATTSTPFTHFATSATLTPTHCHSSPTFPTHPLLHYHYNCPQCHFPKPHLTLAPHPSWPCTITTTPRSVSFLYSYHTLLPIPPHLSQCRMHCSLVCGVNTHSMGHNAFLYALLTQFILMGNVNY